MVKPHSAPIAVVGLACRLPGAPDPAGFWRLLHRGEDAIGEAPAGPVGPPGPPRRGTPRHPGGPGHELRETKPRLIPGGGPARHTRPGPRVQG
ncbi:beta-ketoacyl synthase N-terminal-like domain-containing protein, partial [Streptomyces sp. NPDC059155]|uniref:beta-ketoacyl synthase N-terminal-like domain-containing protein n=1 Tax=Streptomyces sp. NPDC059155 TaxID=3346745 RepID=UPI00368498AC